MSFSAAVGQFTQSDGAGLPEDQVVNTLGFQPRAIIFFGQRAVNQTAAGNYITTMGMAVSSSNEMGTSSSSATALATTDTFSAHSNSSCIYSMNTAGTIIDNANFVSFDASGFTVNWTASNGANNIINSYWALGGADMTHAGMVEIQSPAGTGNQSYTGMGFRPDLLFICSVGSATAPPAAAIAGQIQMFGAADKYLNQGSNSIFIADAAAASNCSKWQRINACINVCGASEAQSFLATIVSMDADGFTLNWATTAGSGRYFWIMGVKGGAVRVFNFAQTTAAAPASQFVNTQHLPDGVWLNNYGTTNDANPSANARFNYGAASGSAAEQCYSNNDTDGADPTDSDRKHDNTMITKVLSAAGATVVEAEFTSFDEHSASKPGGGFTINWTTTDATAREVWGISVGAEGGPKHLLSIGCGT